MRATEPMFRFAHLSDPHLSDPSSARLSELAGKRLLGYLSWQRRRRHEHLRAVLDELTRDLATRAPDHTVVTGDLTQISLPQEFAEARDWLQSVGPPPDVTVIPGNHDAYVRTPRGTSVGLWSDYMSADSAANDASGAFPFVRVRGPVAFIGLNSSLPSPPLFATGRLGEAQIGRLGHLLDSLRARKLVTVLLIHHPPAPGSEKWRKRLVDAPSLCRLLAMQPVDMVLHGHQHRAERTAIAGLGREIPVFGVPSASASGRHLRDPATYLEIDVHPELDGAHIEVKSRRWLGERGRFGQETLAVIDRTF